jgi:hypothetical protein
MTDDDPKFVVRLGMSSNSPDASSAVRSLVDSLTDRGLRHWIYRVEEYETGTIVGFFDGYGLENTLEAIEETAGRPIADIPLPDLDEGDMQATDSDLLAYAQGMSSAVVHSESDPATT